MERNQRSLKNFRAYYQMLIDNIVLRFVRIFFEDLSLDRCAVSRIPYDTANSVFCLDILIRRIRPLFLHFSLFRRCSRQIILIKMIDSTSKYEINWFEKIRLSELRSIFLSDWTSVWSIEQPFAHSKNIINVYLSVDETSIKKILFSLTKNIKT